MATVGLLLDEVWVHIMRRAAEKAQLFLLLALAREAEIDQFYLVGAIDEYVVELEVSMDDIFAVHVGDCLAQLLEDRLCPLFRQSSALLLLSLLDHVVEALAFAKFHHEVDMCSRVDDLVQADNIRVVNHGKYKDLPMQSL